MKAGPSVLLIAAIAGVLILQFDIAVAQRRERSGVAWRGSHGATRVTLRSVETPGRALNGRQLVQDDDARRRQIDGPGQLLTGLIETARLVRRLAVGNQLLDGTEPDELEAAPCPLPRGVDFENPLEGQHGIGVTSEGQ